MEIAGKMFFYCFPIMFTMEDDRTSNVIEELL